MLGLPQLNPDGVRYDVQVTVELGAMARRQWSGLGPFPASEGEVRSQLWNPLVQGPAAG